MVRNLILDFGKVLVDYDFQLFFTDLIPDADKRRDFEARVNTPELQETMDREAVPFGRTIEDLIKRFPEYERELIHFGSHYPDLVTGEVIGMRSLLSRLKSEGFRLYGLSNWCSKVQETMTRYPIFSLLDGYVVSSQVHLIKPEPEIYQHLLRKYGLEPEECVFVDDRRINVLAAERLGMRGILFSSASDLERELRGILRPED